MLSKKTLRVQMLTELKAMSLEQHKERSKEIVRRLQLTSKYQFAKTIAVTMSNFPEVETRRLIESAWQQGKTIVVPKSDPQKKQMTFYKLTSFDDLEVVFAGIEEPIPSRCEKIAFADIELVIVPGVVFNEQGFRIGFGGGFYDRFLAEFRGPTIALAFDEQIIQKIPVDKYDLPVQQILTDKRTVNCSEV